MKIGVYGGSFDIITNGHLWVIQEGSKLFDTLIVAVGIDPAKKYTFSLKERVEIVKLATKNIANVKVESFENQFLVDYARSVNAYYLLRGIRTENDYAYEREMKQINADLNPTITTLFLIPPREIAEISSSMLKSLVGPKGWEDAMRKYVPAAVFDHVLIKLKEKEQKENTV